MFIARLKHYLPRGLYGRGALILLVPILALQIVVSVVFIQRHFEGVTRQMTRNLSYDLRFILANVDAARNRDEAQAIAAQLGAELGMSAVLGSDPVSPRDLRTFDDLSGRRVIEVLRRDVPQTLLIDLRSDLRMVNTVFATEHGPLSLGFARSRVSASNPHQLLVLMAGTGLLMTLISILFLRNQLRPIKKLAEVATAFGRGQNLPYKPAGALEVRAAGAAFLDMRNRIERQIEQRTLMLSGVSHDLRTPLTRFRLGLSMLSDPAEAEELRGDVDEMEHLIDAFLDFASGEAQGEPVAVDPVALLRGVVERWARDGAAVSVGQVASQGTVLLRPGTIERALDNLIGNALRYGTNARVSLRMSDKSLRLRVEDDGPGIPETAYAEAVKPFVRLDAARNQDRGSGVGLGLAIAQDIARSHGGALRLGTSADLGGLCADIVLPR